MINYYGDFIRCYCEVLKYSSYLELGVRCGETIEQVSNVVTDVYGVDIIDNRLKKLGIFYNMTTDEFFRQNDKTFDAIFIDADHIIDSVIKDFKNALTCLNYKGTIFLHDTDPESIELAIPSELFAQDAYKIIKYIYNNYPELDILTMPIINSGLSIIKRKKDNRLYEYYS